MVDFMLSTSKVKLYTNQHTLFIELNIIAPIKKEYRDYRSTPIPRYIKVYSIVDKLVWGYDYGLLILQTR